MLFKIFKVLQKLSIEDCSKLFQKFKFHYPQYHTTRQKLRKRFFPG